MAIGYRHMTIRRIHHFGYRIWLGRPKKIMTRYFTDLAGPKGPMSFLHEGIQYLVPRSVEVEDTSKILLAKKRIYDLGKNDVCRELVLDNNKPTLLKFVLKEENQYESDIGNGIQGTLRTLKRENELIVV